MSDKKWWIITVAGDYGSFALYCDRYKAEEFRRHKARWEAAVAKLREADESNTTDARMIRSARISPCYLDGNLSDSL